MKQRLKFYLMGLLLLLCNTIAWGIKSPAEHQHKEPEFSYISQQQANRQAVYNLFFIYTHTPKEITVKPDNSIPSLKNNIRQLLKTYDNRDFSLTTLTAIKNHTHTYFHPDRVEYYIYTLKKIVI